MSFASKPPASGGLRREYRLPFELGHQGLEGLLDQCPPEVPLFFSRQLRVAEWVGYPDRRDDAVRPDGGRDGGDGAELGGRNPGPLKLFGQRCPAARPRPSRRDEQDGIDPGLLQLAGDRLAHVL
jgi:hypothetical protein